MNRNTPEILAKILSHWEHRELLGKAVANLKLNELSKAQVESIQKVLKRYKLEMIYQRQESDIAVWLVTEGKLILLPSSQQDLRRVMMDYLKYTEEDRVIPSLRVMSSNPPRSNPFHYDLMSQGVHLVRGWTLLFESSTVGAPNVFPGAYFHNAETGQRIAIDFKRIKD